MTPDHEYLVLSEKGQAYWVCVRRPEKPGCLQVVAGFMDEDRAEDYAAFENEFFGDFSRKDIAPASEVMLPLSHLMPTRELPPAAEAPPPEEKVEPLRESELPALPEPDNDDELPELEDHAGGAGIIQVDASEITEKITVTTPPAEPPPPLDDDEATAAGKIPEMIVRLLPFFMEKYPGGPTIKLVAAETKLPEKDIRAAFNQIRFRKIAVVWQKGGGALQVAPLGFERDMHERTKVPQGSLGNVLSDLERKVSRGDQSNPAQYRINPEVRQALAEEGRQPRDVTHLVTDDPPFERSALAAKQMHSRAGPEEAET